MNACVINTSLLETFRYFNPYNTARKINIAEQRQKSLYFMSGQNKWRLYGTEGSLHSNFTSVQHL